MLMIPFSDEPGTYKLFVLLEDDSVERIKAADPAQIKFPIPGFEDKRLKMMFVGYANAADRDHVMHLVYNNKLGEALKYFIRGFQFRPERGDHDGPPMSLKPKEGETKQ